MVERNRLKRLAREVFRGQRPQLPSQDYLVYFFSAAVGVESAELRTALRECLERLQAAKTG